MEAQKQMEDMSWEVGQGRYVREKRLVDHSRMTGHRKFPRHGLVICRTALLIIGHMLTYPREIETVSWS